MLSRLFTVRNGLFACSAEWRKRRQIEAGARRIAGNIAKLPQLFAGTRKADCADDLGGTPFHLKVTLFVMAAVAALPRATLRTPG